MSALIENSRSLIAVAFFDLLSIIVVKYVKKTQNHIDMQVEKGRVC